MIGSRPVGPSTALLATAALLAAMPPAWFPGAEFLVVVGLAGLYAVATRAARPYRLAYLIGFVHVLGFSWSLRHVTGPGYVAIAGLGAVYFVLTVSWTRAFAARALAPLGFALGIAATAWARSHAPEISYPHGQPAHALFGWPVLLGPARFGGEVLVNLLVAGLAAGLAEWCGPLDRRRLGRAWTLGVASLWALLCVLPRGVEAPVGAPQALRIAAFQSAFPVRFGRDLSGFDALARASADLARLAPVPELIVWPESTWPARILGESPRLERQLLPPIPAGAELLTSGLWTSAEGRRAVAMLLGPDGSLRGVHEKHIAVPAGERAPFVHWLPAAASEWLLDLMSSVVGFRPDLLDGRPRPPLQTQGGVPIAALICFDNAFSWVAREVVADGARLILVLSNESWYVEGAELEQMVAMSVFRALETDTAVVRSTVDGVTCVIGADGRVLERLPEGASAGPRAIVREVLLGPGALGAIRVVLPALVGLSLAPLLLIVAGLFRRPRRSRGETAELHGPGSRS